MPPPVRAGAAFGLRFRDERDDDEPFLAALYASARANEVAGFGWPEEMAAAFLAQQHRAQRGHFRRAYPNAEWLIVERDGQSIGRLYVEVTGTAVHGIDIALMPEYRGTGIGGAIMQDLVAHGRDLGKAITVYVEGGNPAARLYGRLGFAPVEGQYEGVYQLYQWRPETDPPSG